MIDARTLSNGRKLEAEVIVIGSGAGGSVAATRLASAGKDVLLLEEGDHHPTSTMNQDEHEMIPRLFQESGQRATFDQSIMVMQGRALGGGTAHNTGLCVPIPEALWERWRAEHAAPCGYAEFRPALDRTLGEICARVADQDEINPNNRLLERGATARGLSYFVARHNRIKCSGCGYCSLGCAYNRKVSVLHAHLPVGVAAGLRIMTGARVTRLFGEENRRRVEIATAAGRSVVAEAATVVLAAGAVADPILLAESGWSRSKVLGKTLRLHPFAPVGAIFADRIEAHRGVPQTIIVDHFADFLRGGDGGFLLMVAAAQPAIAAVMSPALGAAHRRIMQSYPHLAAAGVLVHDRTAGRVGGAASKKPKIDYWPNAADLADLRRGLIVLAEMYFDLGAKAVILPFQSWPIVEKRSDLERLAAYPMRRFDLVLGSVHAQGTCPMGKDHKSAVVDARGEVFGAPGVFVADASLFPTSVGVPPQVTIMSLASEIARGITESRR